MYMVTSALVGGLGCTSLAHAQEINYGGLEAMFGQPVATSATGSPLEASKAPANMQIISADDIRRSGATNIPDILRYVAGIDVRTYGAQDSDVAVRGYSQASNPRLLVLINGRQVYFDDYGYTVWQTLPVQLANIRQIEIVRGPESALFGFNAAAGVINIITYDPLFDRINTLNFGVGTDGTWLGSLVSTLNMPGKGGISVQLGGVRSLPYAMKDVPSGENLTSTSKYGSYAVDARYKPTSHTEVTLEVTRSEADSITDDAIYFYENNPYRSDSVKAGFLVASPIGVVSLQAYINQQKAFYGRNEPSGTAGANQIDVVQLCDLFKVADTHAIRLGVEYRNNRGSGQLYDGSLHYYVFAGDAMWNWQIRPDLSFTAAGRIDHLALSRVDPTQPLSRYTAADFQHSSFTNESYNLGLVWQPTEADTFRLLTGRALQAPSLIDLGLENQVHNGPLNIVFAGNPYLKPAIITNYELDYDRALPEISSTLNSAVFFNTTRDISELAAGLPGQLDGTLYQSYAQNIGSSQSAGGEIELQGASDSGWRWDASYSLVGVHDKLLYHPPATPAAWDDATPTSMIDFGIGYSWQKWEADLNGHWQSRYVDISEATTAGGAVYNPVMVNNYITMSGRVGYQLTSHITLAVAGQQLTGAQIIETSGLKVERRVLFSATMTY